MRSLRRSYKPSWISSFSEKAALSDWPKPLERAADAADLVFLKMIALKGDEKGL